MTYTVSGPWEWDDNYATAYAETNDPRVLAVIQRETYFETPDGDAYAPTLTRHGWRSFDRWATCNSVYVDDDATDAFIRASSHYGNTDHEMIDRYMRAFHATNVYRLSSSIDQYTNVVILDSPAWRDHVGLTAEYLATQDWDRAPMAGEVETWQAYLDGDVYSIGYAVNEERASSDDDINLWEFDIEIVCGGFYSERYAKESAAAFEYGAPDLSPFKAYSVGHNMPGYLPDSQPSIFTNADDAERAWRDEIRWHLDALPSPELDGIFIDRDVDLNLLSARTVIDTADRDGAFYFEVDGRVFFIERIA